MKFAVLKFERETIGGHTNSLNEMRIMCKDKNYEFKCFTYTPKARKSKIYKIVNFPDLEMFEFTTEDKNKVIEELNTYDVIALLEPPTKKATKKEAEVFVDIYRKADKPVHWLFSQNIRYGYIKRLREIYSIIGLSDVISTASTEYEWAKIGLRVGKEWFKTPILNTLNKFDINYNNEDREKLITYIGRYESYKGANYMTLVSKKLAEHGFKMRMMGIDRSPASFHGLLQHEEVLNGNIEVTGNYVAEEASETLRKTIFGFQPMNMSIEQSGGYLETAQFESIGSGCIPILHKNSKEFMLNGRKMGDIENFAIWFDENNIDDFINDIITIYNDKELLKKYKETSYKEIRKFLDEQNICKVLENIKNIKRDRIEVDELLTRCGWSEEEIQKYNEANKMEYFIKQDVELLNSKKILMVTGKHGGSKPYDKIKKER